MTTSFLTERAADLGGFARAKSAGRTLPFTPLELTHIYIRLDFKTQFENARNADDARGFLRSVARASMAAHLLAERYNGVLMEVQGSTLHAALPHRPGAADALAYVADLHAAYRVVFADRSSRVEGWRMTLDAGRTLVVAGRGVHGDDSWVSLGSSANRPAKYLYAQLELPEDRRDLKRFHAAIRNPQSGGWRHEDLDRLPTRLTEVKAIAEEARNAEPALEFLEAVPAHPGASARAIPIGPPGSPSSPSAERPHTYFGWVMRTDLDGFSARVDVCFRSDQDLQQLAVDFYALMDQAVQFAALHKESLVQFPWAGDNFTAAAVFATKEAYDAAMPHRLVELSLDFEKEMSEAAVQSGFGGWAHVVAGGTVHGNAGGNVYLGGVLLPGRRFLVGAGEGFGRSTQAFGDINPKARDLVVYEPDWERLDEQYKKAFEPGVTHRGERSTLYRASTTDALLRVRARRASVAGVTVVSVAAGRSQPMPTRPYFA